MGVRFLFRIETLSLGPGDRAALVGPNGVGKSTLLGALAALAPGRSGAVQSALVPGPEVRGSILWAPACRAVFIPQSLPDRAPGPLRPSGGPSAVPWEHLSPGQRMQILLDAAFAAKADALLLDEPTSCLDPGAVLRLGARLHAFPGAVLMATHDRALVEAAATAVWELDRPWQPTGADLRIYPGGYSAYREQKRVEQATGERAVKDFRQREAHLAEVWRRQAEWTQRAFRAAGPRNPTGQKGAKMMARRATAQARRLERLREEAPQRPFERPHVHLPAGGEAHGGRLLLRTERLRAGFPVGGAAIDTEDLLVEPGARILVHGPNGAGKTTLLRTLLGEIPPLAGMIWRSPSLRCAFVSQLRHETQGLAGASAASLLAQDGRTVHEGLAVAAALGLRGERAQVPTAALSGGERTALALALALTARAHLVVLDEPTSHLDLWLGEAVEEVLDGFPGAVVMASHDAWLLGRWQSGRWRVEHGRVTREEGPWAPEDPGSPPVGTKAALRATAQEPSSPEELLLEMRIASLADAVQQGGRQKGHERSRREPKAGLADALEAELQALQDRLRDLRKGHDPASR